MEEPARIHHPHRPHRPLRPGPVLQPARLHRSHRPRGPLSCGCGPGCGPDAQPAWAAATSPACRLEQDFGSSILAPAAPAGATSPAGHSVRHDPCLNNPCAETPVRLALASLSSDLLAVEAAPQAIRSAKTHKNDKAKRGCDNAVLRPPCTPGIPPRRRQHRLLAALRPRPARLDEAVPRAMPRHGGAAVVHS